MLQWLDHYAVAIIAIATVLLMLFGCVTTPKDFTRRLEKLEERQKQVEMVCKLERFTPCVIEDGQ